jgi:molybdenum cofactor cytidylyltransferase
VSVAAVVLAAGSSSRLGEPKQLVRLGGENLLERAVRVACEAGCAPVVVVLGAGAEMIRSQCSMGDARVLVNEGWEEGMASSIRLGMGILEDVEGVVLMTCDQPAVTVGHLSRLMVGDEVKASRYAGRNGIPAFFPAGVFGDLMELRGDKGARELLVGAGFVELEGGELDLDTRGDLEQVRELFG